MHIAMQQCNDFLTQTELIWANFAPGTTSWLTFLAWKVSRGLVKDTKLKVKKSAAPSGIKTANLPTTSRLLFRDSRRTWRSSGWASRIAGKRLRTASRTTTSSEEKESMSFSSEWPLTMKYSWGFGWVCIAQWEHFCFSPSSPRFKSQLSRYFFSTA